MRGELGWLSEKYGVDPDSLDSETRDFVLRCGERGVDQLVRRARGTSPYRDRRITTGERLSLRWQIERLDWEGGGEWAPGERSIGEDTPSMWIENEIDYLSD